MKTAADKFRNKYTYINEETLNKAALENPLMVVELLNSDVNILTKSLSLIALGDSGKYEFLDLILSFKNHEEPLVRESVIMALSSLVWDHEDKIEEIKALILSVKEKENSPGVLKRIECSLDFINNHFIEEKI